MHEQYLPKDRASLIAHIVEGAAEVIQMYAKAQRFGWNSYHPEDPYRKTNAYLFNLEVDDLCGAIDRYMDNTHYA